MNTLQHLLAQAFHDNHPGPEDPCATCVQQADLAVRVLRDHPGLLEGPCDHDWHVDSDIPALSVYPVIYSYRCAKCGERRD